MIGAGAVGASTAWHLAGLGYTVSLIDHNISESTNDSLNRNAASPLTGTTASLGVLMGYVHRRSSGRAWRLRQRSMGLWPEWIAALTSEENPLRLERPLVQLAGSEAEAERMRKLVRQRPHLGLEEIPSDSIQGLRRCWPCHPWGGLLSHGDGWVDPLKFQQNLRSALKAPGRWVDQIEADVEQLERTCATKGCLWQVHLTKGSRLLVDVVVLCNALGSEPLLKSLGHNRPMKPVLGQALELQLAADGRDWQGWPAVLVSQGINMIPTGQDRLLIGASLEPGDHPDPQSIETMRHLSGNAPEWLMQAKIINHWHGLRARPEDRPAPLLEVLEPGLVLATAHYRNGVLLAPASAEWVAATLKQSRELTCS